MIKISKLEIISFFKGEDSIACVKEKIGLKLIYKLLFYLNFNNPDSGFISPSK